MIKSFTSLLYFSFLLILFTQIYFIDDVFALHENYEHDIHAFFHDEETNTLESNANKNILLAESYIQQKKYAYAALSYDKAAKFHNKASFYHIHLGDCDTLEKDLEHCDESFYHKNQASKLHVLSALNYVKINEHPLAAEQYLAAALNDVSLNHFTNASDNYSLSAISFMKFNNLENYETSNALSLKYDRMSIFGENYILPPSHQIHLVDDPTKIDCKDRLFSLIFKSSTGSPACVSFYTASKLIERGWGHH